MIGLMSVLRYVGVINCQKVQLFQEKGRSRSRDVVEGMHIDHVVAHHLVFT